MSWKKRFCILYRKSEEKSYGNIQRTFHSCIGVKHHMMTTAFFCFCLFHSKTMTGISLKRVHRMIISAHSCFKYTKMHKLLKLTKCLCLLKMHCMQKKKIFCSSCHYYYSIVVFQHDELYSQSHTRFYFSSYDEEKIIGVLHVVYFSDGENEKKNIV